MQDRIFCGVHMEVAVMVGGLGAGHHRLVTGDWGLNKSWYRLASDPQAQAGPSTADSSTGLGALVACGCGEAELDGGAAANEHWHLLPFNLPHADNNGAHN